VPTTLQSTTFSFIDKKQLVKFKSKAIRAGVWFKVLPRIDRVLIDLAIRVARNIRSASLTNSILSITKKLECLLESKFARAIKEIGFPLARRLSLQAMNWGNNRAHAWAEDVGFARYLATMKLNGHPPGNG
jgi:hypothetical protein